jgi:hypothetical protein
VYCARGGGSHVRLLNCTELSLSLSPSLLPPLSLSLSLSLSISLSLSLCHHGRLFLNETFLQVTADEATKATKATKPVATKRVL